MLRSCGYNEKREKCNRSYKKENRARSPSYNRVILPYINGRHVEGSFAGRERGVSGPNRAEWRRRTRVADPSPEGSTAWRRERERGRPRKNWVDVIKRDLKNVDLTWEETEELAYDIAEWRRRVAECSQLDVGLTKVRCIAYLFLFLS